MFIPLIFWSSGTCRRVGLHFNRMMIALNRRLRRCSRLLCCSTWLHPLRRLALIPWARVLLSLLPPVLPPLLPPVFAGIVWSGLVEIDIPDDFAGITLDLETGSTSTAQNPDALHSWDLNFFFGGLGIASSDRCFPVQAGTDPIESVLNLAAGTIVSQSTEWYGTAHSGSGGDQGSYHIGSGPDQFIDGTPGYLGFSYRMEGEPSSGGTGIRYGWMRLTLTDGGGTGMIHEWAYEDSDAVGASIEVGAIPEAAACALGFGALAAAAATARRMRRRKDAA